MEKIKILFLFNKYEKEETKNLIEKQLEWFKTVFNVWMLSVDTTKESFIYEEKVFNKIKDYQPEVVITLWLDVSSKYIKNDFPTFRFQKINKRHEVFWNYWYELYCGKWYGYYKVRRKLDVLETHIKWIFRTKFNEFVLKNISLENNQN